MAFFALGLILITSSVISGHRPVLDFFRGLRIIEHACFMLLVYFYSNRSGCLFLKSAVLGLFVSGVINYYFSLFVIPLSDDLLIMHGQNTPIVNFAFGLHFIYLIYFLKKRLGALEFIMLFTFSFLVLVGGSRSAYIVFLFALISYSVVLYKNMRFFNLKSRYAVYIFLGLLLAFAFYPNAERSIANKFERIEVSAHAGDVARLEMLYSSIDILKHYPFGVGLSGYFHAEHSIRGLNVSPLTQLDFEDNPHSTYLYYMVSGGWPALILLISILYLSYKNIIATFKLYGHTVLGHLFFTTYLFIGLVVPFLLNSLIFILPASVLWQRYKVDYNRK